MLKHYIKICISYNGNGSLWQPNYITKTKFIIEIQQPRKAVELTATYTIPKRHRLKRIVSEQQQHFGGILLFNNIKNMWISLKKNNKENLIH